MAPQDVSPIEVGQTYLELHHQLHRHVDQVMSSAGLSLARAKVLMRLSEGGPMNQAKLAGVLGFAPRSVTDTIDALERDGLVTRTEDERDRRARIVSMTAAGSAALEAALIVRGKAMDEIFGSLPAGDRATLVDLLRTVKTNFPSGESNCVQ
ncbi:DNA-binding transcriptional regulator, MarR family [Frankineae bacterium MT45]|nr:DNA-binding transcriptional regulator, MarR family [Frankineae bacterium MT45]